LIKDQTSKIGVGVMKCKQQCLKMKSLYHIANELKVSDQKITNIDGLPMISCDDEVLAAIILQNMQ
jgi:hypothetical protein